jgi:hypothetical protein
MNNSCCDGCQDFECSSRNKGYDTCDRYKRKTTIKSLITQALYKRDETIIDLVHHDPYFYQFYQIIQKEETPEVILDFIVKSCQAKNDAIRGKVPFEFLYKGNKE